MKFIFLDQDLNSITGGHKYNDAFIEYLSKNNEIVTTPSCATLYSGWNKIIAPFMELRRLSLLKNGDVIFWGDTSYKYHFLLLFFTWLSCKRVTSVSIVHHFLFLNDKGIKKYINFCIQYLYYKLCDYIIVPSPYTQYIARQLFKKDKVFYIPLPFSREFKFSENYVEGNYLYVGTIEERKGLVFLIEALGILKNEMHYNKFILNIVGKISESAYYERLISMIKDLDLTNNVIFHGRVSDERLNLFYEQAEIFTFPSLLEGYGIVLVEAISRGVPIVAFNNSAMPYTIEDGVNGLLASDRSALSLANKIKELSGNDKLRLKLQEGMKVTISTLKTYQDFINGIDDFCKSIDLKKEVFNQK